MPAPVTLLELTDEMLDDLLERAHEIPVDVRHAASCVRYSPGATDNDRRKCCDAINTRDRVCHHSLCGNHYAPGRCGGQCPDAINARSKETP